MPGSPWESGYCESFNSKLRDKLLNREIFYTDKEAKVIIERWRGVKPPLKDSDSTCRRLLRCTPYRDSKIFLSQPICIS